MLLSGSGYHGAEHLERQLRANASQEVAKQRHYRAGRLGYALRECARNETRAARRATPHRPGTSGTVALSAARVSGDAGAGGVPDVGQAACVRKASSETPSQIVPAQASYCWELPRRYVSATLHVLTREIWEARSRNRTTVLPRDTSSARHALRHRASGKARFGEAIILPGCSASRARTGSNSPSSFRAFTQKIAPRPPCTTSHLITGLSMAKSRIASASNSRVVRRSFPSADPISRSRSRSQRMVNL